LSSIPDTLFSTCSSLFTKILIEIFIWDIEFFILDFFSGCHIFIELLFHFMDCLHNCIHLFVFSLSSFHYLFTFSLRSNTNFCVSSLRSLIVFTIF
jgi:hypothetical protein